jgi:hypothetical protein
MNRRASKQRNCWEDRFRAPTFSELRGVLNKPHEHLLEVARERLIGLEGVQESIEWRGIPWRWTLAYAVEGRSLAYLVPQPGRPRMAIPLADDLLAAMDLRKASKLVRDAIVFAPRVGDVIWPAWDLQNRAQIDELVGVARRKHELLLLPTA